MAGLSRSHFSFAFRRSVGRSPHEHIAHVRIERAIKLMLDTKASLSEVAYRHGFCDQAHFANAFRRKIGMTPMKWRRLHQPALEVRALRGSDAVDVTGLIVADE